MGSVYQEKNKTWTVRYEKPTEDGTRGQGKVRGFASKEEATLALAKLTVAISRGDFTIRHNDEILIKDFIPLWLKEVEENANKIKTYLFYKERSAVIVRYLGDITLADLKAFHIDRMYRQLAKETKSDGKPLSSATIHHTHKTLRKILNDAVRWKYITSSPIIDLQAAPKLPKTKTNYWTPDQISQALQFFEGSNIYFHVAIALYTGMRIGEICAMNRRNLSDGKYTITETCSKIEAEINFNAPKSDGSADSVILIPSAMRVIQDHMAYMPESFRYPGYISVWEDGRFMDPGYVSKLFHKMLTRQTELPVIRFHDLRHSCAVWLISKGVDLKTLQTILRHDDFNVTANTYADILDDNKKAAMMLLEQPQSG